jgi:hypothetical protein
MESSSFGVAGEATRSKSTQGQLTWPPKIPSKEASAIGNALRVSRKSPVISLNLDI